MPRDWVFSGAPADSQEHLWPNWAAPTLAGEGPLPQRYRRKDGRDPALDQYMRGLGERGPGMARPRRPTRPGRAMQQHRLAVGKVGGKVRALGWVSREPHPGWDERPQVTVPPWGDAPMWPPSAIIGP